jgi:maleamate amidohydrolase
VSTPSTDANPDADLDADYAGAGFGAPLGFGHRPALLIIDFAVAYLDPASPLYAGVETTLASCRRVLDAARAADVFRVFTAVVFHGNGEDGGVWYTKIPSLSVFDFGSPFASIAPELSPRPDELVVSKQYASAFFGTSLASTLTAKGVDTVILTGLTTSGCIRATGVDSMQHGFRTVIVEDAVGDRDERPHRANLFDLGAKYADVVSEQTVVAYFESLSRD